MGFADDSIAADSAQFFRNLACGHTFGPELLQALNSFIRPGHSCSLLHSAVNAACCSSRASIGEEAMNSESQIAISNPPGVPVIRSVNWGGLRALYMKEVRRFFKVHTQTIWARQAPSAPIHRWKR